MRMKDTGISTALLVAIPIIIVVAVVVPIVVVVVRSGGGAGGVPVYSGASELTSQTQGNTTTTIYDLGTTSGNTVFDWYKTEMASAGWTVDPGDYGTYGGLIHCTKGTDSADILVTIGAGSAQYGYSGKTLLVLSFTAGTAPSENVC